MKIVMKKRAGSNERKRQVMETAMGLDPAREARLAAIQMLIPLGLTVVQESLNKEWASLVGERYARGKVMGPWGTNAGSVYLGDQKARVTSYRILYEAHHHRLLITIIDLGHRREIYK
jgi:mRNA-degrading endonuclease RelE of RelBE toxin-antitoxin system